LAEEIKRVRIKPLRRLLLAWYMVFYDMRGSEVAQKIYERLRRREPGARFTPENIAMEMSPSDIAGIIGVSERVAADYVAALRIIYAGTARKRPAAKWGLEA